MTEAASPPVASWVGSWNAEPGSLAAIRAELVGFADAAGASRRTRDALALAVTEAAANAIVHAYPDRAPGQLFIQAGLGAPGRLRVVVRDDGCGMRSRIDSPGVGLGLALIVQLADAVVVRTDAGTGTEVDMEFALDS